MTIMYCQFNNRLLVKNNEFNKSLATEFKAEQEGKEVRGSGMKKGWQGTEDGGRIIELQRNN